MTKFIKLGNCLLNVENIQLIKVEESILSVQSNGIGEIRYSFKSSEEARIVFDEIFNILIKEGQDEPRKDTVN